MSNDSEIDNLLSSISNLTIKQKYTEEEKTAAIKIQAWWRGTIFRRKRLPNILYYIQKYLKEFDFKCSNENEDGRINSCSDENNIIKKLIERFPNKIKTPKKIRHWFDILVYDFIYGWLPVNIKTTTTITNDNSGNLSICVYAYTDVLLDYDTPYYNGELSNLFFEKIKNKDYNKIDKKDYYFLVINKNNSNDIIINSVKGLTTLEPNLSNLPFQICWNKNKDFNYKPIRDNIKMVIDSFQKPNRIWIEIFLENIRTIKL